MTGKGSLLPRLQVQIRFSFNLMARAIRRISPAIAWHCWSRPSLPVALEALVVV